MSGIKVVDPKPDVCCRPSCVWSCFDFYPNDRTLFATDSLFTSHF